MSTFPDLYTTMPTSRECRVTKFSSNISPYPSIRGSYLSHVCFSAVERHYSLCVGHFFKCWTVEILHWFQHMQDLTEARWLPALLLFTISLEIHINTIHFVWLWFIVLVYIMLNKLCLSLIMPPPPPPPPSFNAAPLPPSCKLGALPS